MMRDRMTENKILIIEDDTALAGGLCRALSSVAGIVICGEAEHC